MADADLTTRSTDYTAMADYWQTVDDVLAGTSAMRAHGFRYLPKFPNESEKDHAYRIKSARFTGLFGDITGDLAAKPFAKEVALLGEPAPALQAFLEDVDRQGNHLHAFAFSVFSAAISYGIDWILVDHTTVPEGATLADERAMGSGPYWVRVPATSLLAVYSAWVDGREQIVYARINESRIERRDGNEVSVARARVLVRDPILDDAGAVVGYEPARFEVWEQTGQAWLVVDQGQITIGVIPLAPLILGERIAGTWQVRPPLRNVLDLQIEHFQQETNLKIAKELTAFPMFQGMGLSPPVDKDGKNAPMSLGPSTVLYAPMDDQGNHGQWGILEISASSLQFLTAEIDKTAATMRELGRQPLVGGTAGMTQATALLAAQKASSTAQAWAWLLKDALEQAFVFTAQWLGVPPPDVFVHTDFMIEVGSDAAPQALLSMKQSGDLSTETLWAEYKRRGILSPEFDADQERERILADLPGDDDEDVAAVTG